MNLQCDADAAGFDCDPAEAYAYKLGHRDARHAAAELALKADAELDDVWALLNADRESFHALQVAFNSMVDALAYLHNMTPEQLDALRKDSERLDWIAQQSLEDLSLALVVDGARCGQYYVSGDAYEAGYGHTLRAAIDAAMNAGKPELQAPKTSAP